MDVRTHGLLLFTERFDECVSFYRDIIGLAVWFEKPGLVCFRFGDGYLMVERGGIGKDGPKPKSSNPTVLRFNVDDVSSAAQDLRHNGVDVEERSYDWGTVGNFTDPDGNVCELKNADDPFFAG